MEDEPRKQPKPVPFCQSSLIQPTVPEVSLLLQEKFFDDSDKTKASVSGFQTYNTWRWKQMDLNNEKLKLENKDCKKFSTSKECHLFQDKYIDSDIEKRKNEILYGQLDEPRRPLPPRSNPVPPESPAFFLDSSFKDLNLKNNQVTEEFHHKKPNSISDYNKASDLNSVSVKKDLDDYEKLYNIISEQNKQIAILQKQVQQILKLQEVKDKHVEQLLKSQESKEKQIEQLLQSIDAKDKDIAHLKKLKEKQEQQLLELKDENTLQNRSKSFKQTGKKTCSVGVMTDQNTVETGTNTSFENNIKGESETSNDESNKNLSFMRSLHETEYEKRDKSLSLKLPDLPEVQEHIPTPLSSIHVDIQDFHDSSQESNCDSETDCFPAESQVKSNSLGYTFYNNVLAQVKDIIHNSNNENKNILKENYNREPFVDYEYIKKIEKVQSLQTWQFEKENIQSFSGEIEKNDVPERILKDSPIVTCNDTHSPSDISLKINALALKYLKQDQILHYDFQSQMPLNSYQRDVTIYNVTNLSFGPVRCVDKYQLVSKSKGLQHGPDLNQIKPQSGHFHQQKKKRSSTDTILDKDEINQQPKLL